MATTTYAVELTFGMKGDPTKKLDGVGAAAAQATNKALSLKEAVGAIGLAWAGNKALAGLKYLGTLNSELDGTKLKLRTLTQLNLGSSFLLADQQADMALANFDALAQKLPATRDEMLAVGQAVQGVYLNLGKSTREWENFTAKGASAAKVLGFDTNQAGEQLSKALNGKVEDESKFVIALLRSQNVSLAKFTAMNAKGREKVLSKALDSDAIKDATKAFDSSFAGSVSRLQSSFQTLAETAGKPLFELVTSGLNEASQWAKQHGPELKKWATDFGTTLASTVKSTFGFVVENKGTFLAIGAALGIAQGASGLSGVLGTLGIASTAFGTAGTAALGLAGSIATTVAAFGALYVGIKALTSWFDSKQSTSIRMDGGYTDALQANLKKSASGSGDYFQGTRSALIQARESGAIDYQGNFDQKIFSQFLVTQKGVSETYAEALSTRFAKVIGETAPKIAAQYGYQPDKPWSMQADSFMRAEPPVTTNLKKTQITVNLKMEVKADDPDRFVAGVADAFEKMAANPTQAKKALRGL